MLPLALVAALLVAETPAGTPYVDTQKRFALQLPSGWRPAPMPGDLGGTSFRRQEGGALALMQVEVFHFPAPVGSAQFDARVLAAYDQEVGFSLQPNTQGPTQLAGRPAMRRRFLIQVAPGRQLFRLVEQHTLVVDQTGYALGCESLSDNFSAFAHDCQALVASFRPGQDIDTLPHRRRRPEPLAARHLIGRWQGGSHTLRLTPGGTVVLDRLEGTWHIDHGILMLSFDGQSQSLEVEHGPQSLVLHGGPFGDAGVSFRPQAAAAAPAASQPAPAAAAPPPEGPAPAAP